MTGPANVAMTTQSPQEVNIASVRALATFAAVGSLRGGHFVSLAEKQAEDRRRPPVAAKVCVRRDQ